ncbi:MAG: polyhydroxyalkanoate synthase [Gammaproteobacteria bacterium]|nr:MAG: polyhydroxyalkanoate synthase [Gammaproteobacteria bacterium]
MKKEANSALARAKRHLPVLDHNSALGNTYRFFRHAVERRTHKERFIVANKSTYQEVYRDGLMQLRYYPHQDIEAFELDNEVVTPISDCLAPPVLLVPPLGVFGWVYDLMAERSWVRFLNAKGFDVYLVDWGAPQKEHANLDMDTYINRWLSAAVDKVLEHSASKKISLIGYCMGGLLTLLYAGIQAEQGTDDKIKNIVTIASPIDFYANHFYGALLSRLSTATEKLPFTTQDLDHRLFHVPGDVLSVMFKLTNPLASVVSYFDLVKNMSDRDYIKAHLTTKEWFNNMPDYPGATVQQLVFDIGFNNRLAKGEVKIGDKLSNLTKIKANLLSFAGDNDKIVSKRAAEKIMDIVASEDRTFKVVPGGHAGVFAGGKAKEHTWAITAGWLTERSTKQKHP